MLRVQQCSVLFRDVQKCSGRGRARQTRKTKPTRRRTTASAGPAASYARSARRRAAQLQLSSRCGLIVLTAADNVATGGSQAPPCSEFPERPTKLIRDARIPRGEDPVMLLVASLTTTRTRLVASAVLLISCLAAGPTTAPSADQPLPRDPNNLYGQFD